MSKLALVSSTPEPIPPQMSYTLAEWLALPEWLHQRDTRKQADKIYKSVDFDPHHQTLGRHVAVIKFRGVEYRGDGNSTALLCREGKAFLPPAISAAYYDVGSDEVLGQKIYKAINNKVSGKTAEQVLTSALSINKIAAKSGRVSGGKFTTAVSISTNAVRGVESNSAPENMDEAIKKWKSEVVWMDTLLANGTNNTIAQSTAVLSAMLMSRYRYSIRSPDIKERTRAEHVEDFWVKFHTNRGKGHTEDPWVRAWNHVVKHIKNSGGQRHSTFSMVEVLLGCVEAKGRPAKIMKRAIKSYLLD